MVKQIRVYYYDKQKMGNYQIKVGKKKEMDEFAGYVNSVLKSLNPTISHYRKDPLRRYYVEEVHIDHMMNDELIDLVQIEKYGWRDN